MAQSSSPPKMDKRVSELMQEEGGRPRADSDGTRTRSWSGTDFDGPGRPRTFSFGGKKKRIVAIAVDASENSERAFDCTYMACYL